MTTSGAGVPSRSVMSSSWCTTFLPGNSGLPRSTSAKMQPMDLQPRAGRRASPSELQRQDAGRWPGRGKAMTWALGLHNPPSRLATWDLRGSKCPQHSRRGASQVPHRDGSVARRLRVWPHGKHSYAYAQQKHEGWGSRTEGCESQGRLCAYGTCTAKKSGQ